MSSDTPHGEEPSPFLNAPASRKHEPEVMALMAELMMKFELNEDEAEHVALIIKTDIARKALGYQVNETVPGGLSDAARAALVGHGYR